jgi:formylglycine-generating enzyme required for sulfatase activity
VRGGSRAEETATSGPDVVEVEVVSISFGEPSNLVEVARPSRNEGPATLIWVGRDPFQWGGPCLT